MCRNRFLTFVFMLILGVNVCVFAQKSDKNFYFVYIDHEATTDVNSLCDKIKELRTDALESGDAVIVYLANGNYPMISLTNVPDPLSIYTGDDPFNAIIGGLQEMIAHDVIPDVDLTTICKLMDWANLNSDDMRLNYETVTIDMYVGPDFWDLGYNERLISRLYDSLEIPLLQQEELYFNLYKTHDQEIKATDDKLFGLKNVDGINKLRILEY